MAWIDIASKLVTEPVTLVSIAWSSGTLGYSDTWVRISGTLYKGNIMNLPQVKSSIGDLLRTHERNKITIIFADTDKEMRTKLEDESPNFKNIVVTITSAFVDDTFSATKVLSTGQISDWRMNDNLLFEIEIEELSIDLDNEFPDQIVNLADYANADGESLDWSILIPYGPISALGSSGDGAYGHPALTDGSGLPFVDTTPNAEIHLVGMQTAAIIVDRVYMDKRDGNGAVLQTAGGGNDYQITTQVIGGMTHTLIEWEAGANPLPEYRISCDITFGSRRPVAGIKHFLENFSSYASFDAAALAEAEAKELSRGYDFSGVIWEPQDLASLLDVWRDQWELDIFWNKAGEVTFKYMSSEIGSDLTKYNDLNDILEGFKSDPDVKKLLNYADYAHTFHWSKTYYLTHGVYQDTDSQTKYAITVREFIGLRWTRLASVAFDIASRKIIRRKDPMTLISLRLPIKSFEDDLADFVKITHDFGSGAAGYMDKFCQIRSTDYDLDEYVNNMLLEDASNFAGNAFILGDGDILPELWDNAVGGERDYGYLCDGGDGFFSNDVDPGKRLFD